MRELHETYGGRGLLVLGVHSPEFDHERDAANVRREIARQGIPFPVLIDNDFAIWKSFGNSYWPALYLIDREGIVRWAHAGELHRATPAWKKLAALIEDLLPPPAPRDP